jgi:aldehyde:ferredoxin oxidoreductase
MSKILRVDMSSLRVEAEEAPEEYRLLGGRALSSHIVAREVPAACHPLSAHNRLVFAPGLLGGTAATTSGRTSVGAKSPLTGGIKEANVGGQLGHKLAKLGIKAVVIQGQPPDSRWRLLRVDAGGARLEPADELAGLGNYDAAQRLLSGGSPDRPPRLSGGQAGGRSSCVVSIGPAGEMRMAAASVAVSDPEGRPTRHAARGGLGALMGAKGLKAILVDDAGTKNVEAADRDQYRQRVLAFSRTVLDDPRTKNMSMYGTAGVIRFVNRENVASMPTRNHRLGVFPEADAISGQHIAELAPARSGRMLPCMAGCIIKCAILFNDEEGQHLTSALEFETIALMGSNLEISDIDGLARLDHLCDDIGLDTIEIGNAIGVTLEAGLAPFGDWRRVVGLLEEVRRGTPLGRILGGGTELTARAFGIDRVPAVKGQGLPAWEPRTLKAMGITYATSPQGGDHTAGLVTARNVTPDTLLKASRHEQILQAAVDSVGLCQFSNPTEADMARLVSAEYGVEWGQEDVLEMGRRVLKEERDFNLRAGFGRDADYLPEFLRTEPLHTPDGDMVFDLPDELLESFWDF